jgi:putative transposase
MKSSEAKRQQELELWNVRLKKLVAEQALDLAMLREAASGNW